MSTLLFFGLISALLIVWVIAVLVWLGEIPGDTEPSHGERLPKGPHRS